MSHPSEKSSSPNNTPRLHSTAQLMASTHSPPSSGFCGLSCFGNNDATEIIGEKSVAPRRKRLSMWNGELEDPSDMPAVKNRLSPEELHRLPEQDVLNDIAKVTLLDKNRHKTTFGELTNDPNYKRIIVIFIRHFFCGVRRKVSHAPNNH